MQGAVLAHHYPSLEGENLDLINYWLPPIHGSLV